MRSVQAADIRRVLTFPLLIDALEAAHRRPPMETQDAFLGDARYFVRHAVDRGRYMASKLITSFPDNPGQALPAVQAVCVLFDGTNGAPLAVLDGTEITYWRTAADSALGAKLLSNTMPETMLQIGAGDLAPWLVRAHRAVRPSLERVLIWNRTPARAHALAALLREEGTAAEVANDLDTALAHADLISAATRTKSPLIKGAHLKPGAHLDLVGGYTPDMREADDAAVRRARVFVDRRTSAFDGAGDILQPIANGTICDSDVLGDLYDLVQGRVEGRRSPSGITFFKNAGGGHLDLMTAEVVYRRMDEIDSTAKHA